MYGRRIQGAAAVMGLVMLLTGGASGGVVAAKEQENVVDTGFTVTSVGSYDSADTAVVMSVDQENSGITFLNMDTGKQYTLYYSGTTYFKDKYEGPMTVSQIQPGDIVDVNFLKGKRQIASVQISPQAWCYENIDNYDLGGINHTASIGSSVFSLPDEAAILSGGNRIENMEVVKQDVVTIRGIGHTIYSVDIEKGHGYLRLKNDDALIGGWIEVGNSVICQITEDMLLTVPEGEYQVLLSNGKASCTKEVQIERNKELVLDVGDIQIEEEKTGKIVFSVTPATAQVSVDDEVVDISQPIELPYGIHKVYMEADGYYPLQKHVQVGSEYANISFTMEPKEEESSVSENSTGDDWDQPQQKTYDLSQDEEVPFKQSVSENTTDKQSVSANSTNANNKVYVDIKGGQEGVEVYLDGYYIGNAPVKFKKVTGSHTISLRKEGYHTRSYTIYLYNDGDDITYSCEPLVKKEEENNDKPSNSTSSDSTSVSDNSMSTGSTSSDSTSTGSTSSDTTSTGSTSSDSTSTGSTSSDSTSTGSTSSDSTSTGSTSEDTTSTGSTSEDTTSTGSSSSDTTSTGSTSGETTSEDSTSGSSTEDPSKKPTMTPEP